METVWLQQSDISGFPEEIRPYTTSAFSFLVEGEHVADVGLMRLNLFDPPYIWLTVWNKSAVPLRAVPWALRGLLAWLELQVVYAEVDSNVPGNLRFATFIGFVVQETFPDRILLSFEV